MYEAIKHFGYYLYTRRFVQITDHRGLVSLRTARQENRRLYNWALKLSEFDFEIVYRSGKENGVADELSRCHEGSDVAVETSPVFCGGGGDVGLPT